MNFIAQVLQGLIGEISPVDFIVFLICGIAGVWFNVARQIRKDLQRYGAKFSFNRFIKAERWRIIIAISSVPFGILLFKEMFTTDLTKGTAFLSGFFGDNLVDIFTFRANKMDPRTEEEKNEPIQTENQDKT